MLRSSFTAPSDTLKLSNTQP
ncbi:hypothetical protein EMIT0P260_10154 [Pseudomonas sp. IT-P260]